MYKVTLTHTKARANIVCFHVIDKELIGKTEKNLRNIWKCQ